MDSRVQRLYEQPKAGSEMCIEWLRELIRKAMAPARWPSSNAMWAGR
jgi:hypothetical protein